MGNFKFFRTPQTRKFDYNPQYWDQKKEELNSRLKNLEKAKKGDPDAMKERISSGLRKGGYRVDDRARTQQAARSNMLLLGIIIGLIFVAFILLTNYFSILLDWLN